MNDLNKIKNTVNNYFNIDCLKKTRKKNYVFARAIFFKIAHETTTHSLQTLGKYAKFSSHCAAIHCLKIAEHELKHNIDFKTDFCNIIKIFKNYDSPEIKELLKDIETYKKIETLKQYYENKILEIKKQNESSIFELSEIGELSKEDLRVFYETRFIPFKKTLKKDLVLK